jgi:MFS family permease
MFLKHPLSLICFAVFVDSLLYGVIIPVIPLYEEEWGASHTELGVFFSIYAIGLILASIPLGIVSDRKGRKIFLVGGMFALSLANLAYALSDTMGEVMVCRALQGISAAATYTCGLSLISDLFPSEMRGEKLGTVMAAEGAGTMAGPLVGGPLLDTLGYSFPFYLCAFLSLIVAFLLLGIKEPAIKRREKSVSILNLVFHNRGLVTGCAIVLIGTMGLGLIELLLPLHLSDRFDIGATGIGVLFGVCMIAFVALQPFVGRLSDRVGRRKPIIMGLIASSLVFPLMVNMNHILLCGVVLAALGISFSLFFASLYPLFSDFAFGRYGAAFSLFNITYSLGYMIGPLSGGALSDIMGGPSSVFYIYSVFPILGAILVARFVKPPAQRAFV